MRNVIIAIVCSLVIGVIIGVALTMRTETVEQRVQKIEQLTGMKCKDIMSLCRDVTKMQTEVFCSEYIKVILCMKVLSELEANEIDKAKTTLAVAIADFYNSFPSTIAATEDGRKSLEKKRGEIEDFRKKSPTLSGEMTARTNQPCHE